MNIIGELSQILEINEISFPIKIDSSINYCCVLRVYKLNSFSSLQQN